MNVRKRQLSIVVEAETEGDLVKAIGLSKSQANILRKKLKGYDDKV